MYKNFEHLLQIKGINAATFSKDTKISQSTISTWKSSGHIGTKYLSTIAEYFDCSIDLIVTGRENEKYYANDATAEIAQEIFVNKDLRMLFDAAHDADPEDLHTVHSMLLALKRKERGNFDD